MLGFNIGTGLQQIVHVFVILIMFFVLNFERLMAFTDHLLLLEKKAIRLTQRFILIRHSKTRRIGITN